MAATPSRTLFLLAQVGSAAAAAFSAAVHETGLTAGEAGVIRILGRQPGISQRALADHVGSPPSRMVALIDALVARDLVTRTRSASDRRNYELRLTEAGSTALASLRAIAEDAEHAFLDALSPAERRGLHGALRKLAERQGLSTQLHAATGG